MKKSLLATVAVAALIAGNGFAAAEGAPKQEAPAQKTEAPTPAPSAQQKAPAEKMAPATKGADIKADGKAKTETTGQAQPKAEQPKAAAEQKSPAQMKASETTKTDTTKTDATKTDATKSAAQPSAQPKASEAAKSGTTTPSSQQQTTGSAPASGGVTLTSEQKTQIRSTVLTSNAPRVTNVNFSISVGTVVPRSVTVVAVPDTLIRIHPAWRGHRYFVYNDEIIIVEADTMRIVAVLVV